MKLKKLIIVLGHRSTHHLSGYAYFVSSMHDVHELPTHSALVITSPVLSRDGVAVPIDIQSFLFLNVILQTLRSPSLPPFVGNKMNGHQLMLQL